MRVVFATGLCAALIAATPVPAGAEGIRADCKTDDGAAAGALPGDMRQLSEVIGIHSCWDAAVDNEKLFFLNDLYSRWVIEEVQAPDSAAMVRDYRAERSNPLVRLFVGRSRGAVMTVRIRMRDPDVEFTLPLLNVDYNGKSGQGQAFITALTTSDMGLPDFRITPNTSATVDATARLSNEVDVQSTGVVLAAVRDTLSIAAPGGSLLTAVNREQIQRVSNAYDSAVSKLLSTTITETSTAGRLMSEWYPGASFLISVDVPRSVRTIGSTDRRTLTFRLSMSCPRPSVFDAMNVCATGSGRGRNDNMRALINSPYRPAGSLPRNLVGRPGSASGAYRQAVGDLRERINPHQVLAFRLGVGKTLRQYLTEQEWFIALSKRMVDPQPADVLVTTAAAAARDGGLNADQKKQLAASRQAADEFCEAVADKLYTAGLSRLDAQIGLWAVATGLPDFAASRTFFQAAPGCVEHLPGPDWSFTEEQPAES